MAFKRGSQGYDYWPDCREYGLAAIGYRVLSHVDLTGVDFSERSRIPGRLLDLWDQLSSSQKASVRHVVCDFQKGDIIYAKSGKQIVGRGLVLGGYHYDPESKIVGDGTIWEHCVPVRWEQDFAPVTVLLGSEQTTVLALSGERLQKLAVATRCQESFVSPQDPKVELAAVRHVTAWYRDAGWEVVSVEADRCGFDLRCTRQGAHEHAEVKGTRGSRQTFAITAKELIQAREDPAFILWVVTDVLSARFDLHRYTGQELNDRFEVEPIRFTATRSVAESPDVPEPIREPVAAGGPGMMARRNLLALWDADVGRNVEAGWRTMVDLGVDHDCLGGGDAIWLVILRGQRPFLSARIQLAFPYPYLWAHGPLPSEVPVDDLLDLNNLDELGEAIDLGGEAPVQLRKMPASLANRLVDLWRGSRGQGIRGIRQPEEGRSLDGTEIRGIPQPEEERGLNDTEIRKIEAAAIRLAMHELVSEGWQVKSVENDHCGYDFHCRREGLVSCVEVKGVKGAAQRFILTSGEIAQATTNPTFSLFVVKSALSKPRGHRYAWPEPLGDFDVRPITFRATRRDEGYSC